MTSTSSRRANTRVGTPTRSTSRHPRGRWPVDTGFIVFNELNYPNFERMLAELGVASQPTDMSFSVSDGRGGFEWATTGPRGLFARPAHALDPRFHRMLRDLVRFNREARKLVGSGGRGPSLRRFLADGGYSDYFVERLLVPQASAVWSADPAQMWSFPGGLPRRVLRQPSAFYSSGTGPPGGRSREGPDATSRR